MWRKSYSEEEDRERDRVSFKGITVNGTHIVCMSCIIQIDRIPFFDSIVSIKKKPKIIDLVRESDEWWQGGSSSNRQRASGKPIIVNLLRLIA